MTTTYATGDVVCVCPGETWLVCAVVRADLAVCVTVAGGRVGVAKYDPTPIDGDRVLWGSQL